MPAHGPHAEEPPSRREAVRTRQGGDDSALPLDSDKPVMVAWERFLHSGELPPHAIRRLIESSWWRCQEAGVDPARARATDILPAAGLGTLQERYRELIAASVPVMAQARDFLAESGTVMVLTDPHGVILETEGDPATGDAAADVRLVAGANWSEAACGTNAIGTAVTTGEPVQVHAAEHFCAGIKPWTCSATVIRDPSSGEILGVLDVSGLRGTYSRHALALVVAAAGRIEARLAVREMELRQRLLEAGLGRLGQGASGGLIFFDRKGRFIKADAKAALSLAALGIRPDLKRDARIEALRTAGPPVHPREKLPDWLRAEWVERIVEGGEAVGSVILVPEAFRARSPGADTRAAASAAMPTTSSLDRLVGASDALRQAVHKARLLAAMDIPVLLLGETGVGKEVFARGIHESGARKAAPFIALNCGGLARDILASELFGYVDGAFSGARRSGMIGKIEAANGGTLFLDEIGEMPLDLQPYLLRVLEGGEVYPLGETRPRQVQFRLVAATNKDLRAEVTAGRFRMDLFYRLSVTSLRIPPLHERKDDIPLLVARFGEEVARRHGMPEKRWPPAVLAALEQYDWPGNVRELRNVVEGMVVMAMGETLTPDDLPPEIAALVPKAPAAVEVDAPPGTMGSLEAAERAAINSAILRNQGNFTRAAKELCISKSTLYLKVKKYGLEQFLPGPRPGMH